ncbi:MAG TPA: bifunctional (p)ppGpp synthetase/guanosine-3',5'-bis(diphosphate) 3'-pyrophosphohydrolase [Kosmotogaceae bacterium]|nr:MAG: (P)ppGpp synthetase, RelA/SpoT family [Thermotogales bacterium 46_20]HAA85525.1 bifunctional (p)ppGpp synthetase/guanosine-3',5'-bis(diphosphate) 3'-pyrophosphohydrolase [Kosmotogaceae bacterium]
MANNFIATKDLVEEIESILGSRFKRSDREKIVDAYEFACTHHENHFRDSGEPFITHPAGVAKILAGLGADVDTIASGLLHDVVEDCGVPIEVVEEQFGERVRTIVDGVTKISNLKLNEKLSLSDMKSKIKVETLRKLLIALANDPRIIIVKLADRLHNMRTMEFLKDEQKRIEKSRETLDIYAPIANRIGINIIKWELEDLAFKYVNPEAYDELKNRVNQRLADRSKVMDEYKEIVASELKKHRIDFRIEGRVKHLYSIWNKMVKKGKSFDEILDLVALRIVTKSELNCYKILGAVHALWPPIPNRFKDYIAAPKSNGYKSLHTTLITHRGEPLEIQIRSERMHREAEIGVASHWAYKENMDLKDRTWFAQLVSWHKDFIQSFEDLDQVSSMLTTDDVFVFTPKGEVIHLPKGATPIDFAYSIHTEIGHHFSQAKVNDRIVPIDYELRLGDRVEVVVNKASQGPSLDWLKYAKSNSTKAKIKRFFRSKYSAELVERGKEIFRKVSKKLAKPMDELIESEPMANLFRRLGITSDIELYMKLGDGSITLGEMLKVLYPEPEDEELPEASHIKFKQQSGNEVVIGGQTGIDVHFARCCAPLPGDSIIGIISSRGISVHNAACRNVKGAPPDKQIDARWSITTGEKFSVWIRVEFDNSVGQLVNKILERIETKNARVTKYTYESNKWGQGIMNAMLLVNDVGHLTSVMESIRIMKGVQFVRRTGALM